MAWSNLSLLKENNILIFQNKEEQNIINMLVSAKRVSVAFLKTYKRIKKKKKTSAHVGAAAEAQPRGPFCSPAAAELTAPSTLREPLVYVTFPAFELTWGGSVWRPHSTSPVTLGKRNRNSFIFSSWFILETGVKSICYKLDVLLCSNKRLWHVKTPSYLKKYVYLIFQLLPLFIRRNAFWGDDEQRPRGERWVETIKRDQVVLLAQQLMLKI